MTTTTVFYCRPCYHCGEAEKMTLPTRDLDRWLAGEYAQTVFHYLSAEEREMLISGVHPECWKMIFLEE